MLNWNNKKEVTNNNNTHNTMDIISINTVLSGDVKIEGDIRVDGKVLGDLKVMGKLVINYSAQISGNIEGVSVSILGKYEGVIRATNLVAVSSIGYLKGDVYTDLFQIEKGGYFNGSCHMEDEEVQELESIQDVSTQPLSRVEPETPINGSRWKDRPNG